jgi:YidC/Oxa1 family membrane protein insertase
MDKNFIIGLVLIMLMLIGYQILVPKPVEPTPVAQVKQDTSKVSVSSSTSDSTQLPSQSSDSAVAQVAPQELVIETKDTRVVFTNKGGVMKEVLLKKYKTYDQKPLYLIAENHNNFRINFPTPTGDVRLTDLFFSTDAQNQDLAKRIL